eukprot:TRINITY_DN9755_c0_g1_i3.p1 TRINITY_DN9755_c0_g1~~TRINITY_DN9755_c0_g1_i3.p1  ORF type:complete len:318 (-),score=85.48 TRINITY_DN9755_c0_g1_i3:188-1141(-)
MGILAPSPKTAQSAYGQENFIRRSKTNFFDDYYLEHKIVSDIYSDMWTASSRKSKDLCGVKIIKKKIIGRHVSGLQTLGDELEVLVKLDSPNVIKVHEIIEDTHKMYVVTEPILGETLLSHILKIPPKDVSEKIFAECIRQVISGLNYCHSMKVIHKDVRPDYIMFADKDNTMLKLTDFGMSRFETVNEISSFVYRSAEALRTNEYDEKSDIWSCGIMCYLLLSGSYPYPETNSLDELINSIKSKVITMESLEDPSWSHISRSAKSFMLRMLAKDPEDRPTAEELLKDPWLRNARGIYVRSDAAKRYLHNLKDSAVS